MKIGSIGVLGAGIMGSGIAQVMAQAGFQVVLRDIEDSIVARGVGTMKKNLDRAVEKGKLTREEAESILGRVRTTTSVEEALRDVDLVVEAVIESMDLKKKVFGEMDALCRPDAILASNTSGLSITEMGSVTRRPDRVIGMHFFNPVPVMKLVELTRGFVTSEDTYVTCREFVEKLGKTPIQVAEAPGFAVNRILCPMINEAVFALAEGVASAEDIDRAMILGANHPIGPLALADMVGLDTLLFVMESLHRELGEDKYRPAPLLRKMVRAGYLGRKSGRGFYDHSR